MPQRILCLLSLLLLLASQSLYATHNRAGEIIIEQIGSCTDLTIRATIITYTKTSAVAADRPSLTIHWGDGTSQEIQRSNGFGNGVPLENDIKYNEYVAVHTYPGRGTYKIFMTDPNRNGGILNVNFPASDNIQFHLQTTYTFLNCQFDGPNSTPILLQPPVDVGCIGQPFIHNPNAFDVDGDSLSYKLVVPFQDLNSPVPNYLWPNQVGPGANNSYILNEVTGDFIWSSPQVPGEYNIAMYIISWRNGAPIDSVLRDMQILIEACEDNRPPVIQTQNFHCVVAGTTLSFPVSANDPDNGQLVRLTALGGPFAVNVSPAQFSAPNTFQVPPINAQFTWQTTCEHISNQPYTVVFKAVDNYFDTTGLATLRTVRIKVVGPPPEDLQAEPSSENITLSWESPYTCENAEDDYFFTFSVWRRDNSNPFAVDTCTPGLAGRGYTRITANTRQLVNGRYTYVDNNVSRGRTYCYRVMATFAKYTDLNPPQPFNLVESLPSKEVCQQLSREVPLLLNVDVEETDPTTGAIFLRWNRPLAEDLDTIQNPGPYTYELHRADGINGTNFQPLGVSFTSPSFWQAIDTTYTDTLVNTIDRGYNYKVEFYVNGESQPLEGAAPASSVFLSIASTDRRNNLSWNYNVPWENYAFTIYRQDNDLNWEVIGTSNVPSYSDLGLWNGKEYCYYIETEGTYGVDGIPSPLFNRSQINCGIPIDTIPPCPPILDVSNFCEEARNCTEADLVNTLTWFNPMSICPETDDVVTYHIYYAPIEGAEFELVEVINFSGDTTYNHRPLMGIAGCYAVTALDTFFNESAFSNIVCVDNCPIYELPNTFTPNGDGFNDLFIPYPYCFVERVEFRVFNRWGEQVWETNDPDLNWNGTNRSGQNLPDGTYYYTCRIFEQRLTGIVPGSEIKSGFIELIR
jgi:gliding motility-associated-like protein